ncbi:winged helix-turn-helix domain-containing protein [Pseudodonghicola xiamenensis]|uniref:DNA-binding response regulator, OmpR family, contains REC and winged-helix (WHTH) domain n=1 Tax=Pseudodonghicola xiamenensis TaxID=337702 RepID=A0A8J3MCE1_9RHOB|nr:winged helix-turn-helix domain-containing protein [Pseudodonghicola xiamenensis]GHG85532.1 hypothetical protein GCM10010961_12670 [Pseudodonghicola xiamenensis]
MQEPDGADGLAETIRGGETVGMLQGEGIQSNQPHALVAEADMACRMGLQHLFSVILELPVRAFADCESVMAQLRDGVRPRVVVVGVPRPATGALTLIREAKMRGACVMALDWQRGTEDAVQAFLAGADDVARAPVRLKELALRMQARLGAELSGLQSCRLDFSADWEAEADIALRAGLTEAEARVVRVLIGRDGHIVTRDELSQAIDRRPWDYGDRKFDVHVAKIRKKLHRVFGSQISVRTVRSSGYLMTVADAAVAVNATPGMTGGEGPGLVRPLLRRSVK